MAETIHTRGRAQRLTVAFFVSELEEDYCADLCRGIIDAAEQHDVNLIIFPGRLIKSIFGSEYNNNVIYEYVNCNNVDALVISALVLSGLISSGEFAAFVLRYKPLPIVSIGLPFEGIPSVLTDNRPGLKQLLNHLINHHHKRAIAFIKGLEGHVDAGQRFSVYREVLRENGIEFDPDLVAPGDFTVASVDYAMKLFDERKVSYDAIATANDIMAFGVLKALRERNVNVPEQVAVTGFDNGEGAKHSSPSLTTVKQPIYEQSKKALEMALELIKGNQPDSVVLDTEMVIRESCGCLSETLQFFDDHTLEFQSSELVKGNVKLDPGLIDSLMDKHLGKITGKGALLRLIKSFITSCIQVFDRDELEIWEVENLFRSFQSMVDVPELEENDILAIQKIITTLKKWIDTVAGNINSSAQPLFQKRTFSLEGTRFQARTRLVEEFFQKLRVFITDRAIKMQGSQLISYRSEIYQLRDVLVQMVLRIHDYHEQFHSVIPRLRSIGIHNCYLYLYDKPIKYSRDDVWRNPSRVNLAVAYNDENWVLGESAPASARGRELPWEEVINNQFLPRNKRYTLMLKPLFVEEEHLGLILMEFNMAHNYLYESLIVEMSCALRLSMLFYEREQIDNRLQAVVKELEDYNRKLKNISQTDELTGLYNRRGFLNLANQRFDQARKEGKRGLVFFADMDGLKKINDQYGHEEGDIAIRTMAKILIKTFFTLDIISRFGGDEFAILAVGADPEVLPKIKERLQKYTAEYNQQSGKPYQVSITIGVVPFDSAEDAREQSALESLISQADKLLYEQKSRKKESVLS